MTACCSNWRYNIRLCDCSLKTFGFIFGWLGVIWRIVATIFLATILSKTTEYDPHIYDIALITCLSYVQVTLVADLFFIVGIQKEKPYFLLPFIVVGGLETIFGLIIIVGGSRILHGMNMDYALWYFILSALILTGIYFCFWIKSIMLFRSMEILITVRKEENARIASIRKSIVES